LVGSLAAYVAASFFFAPAKGTTFNNLNDLRLAMLSPEDKPTGNAGVNLRAILNPHPDDRIIYDLRPDLDVTFQRVPVKTNSCSMRDRERSFAKEPNVFRIALLGDSFAFGWGVEEGKIFASTLERILNEKSVDGRKFEVLNFGVPGYSTFQEVAVFRERALDFAPDAVLVYFIENDFGMPFFIRNSNNPDEISPSASQKKQPPNPDPSRSLVELNDLAREHSIKVYVAFNPRAKWMKDKKKLWALDDLPSVDIIPMFDELVHSIKTREIDDTTLQLPDDPHPSAPKHQLLAEILAPRFLSQ
ncbi:MAG: SGNH/GDSL hydrolase family protein, partial [Deltaproteobacteria bacterium]|nr:SGNH/GDSL hydrolase family protein [Deltaproteobacteria bacterium]